MKLFIRELQEKYGTLCDFVTVYVEEAHPLEKHHFAGNIPLLTHQTIQVSVGLKENDFPYKQKLLRCCAKKNPRKLDFASTLSQTTYSKFITVSIY